MALTDITLFGVDSRTLLETVLAQPAQPLFWVDYDAYFRPSYSPGAGMTSVTLAISAREDEPVIQRANTDGPFCEPTSVSVPVHVSLQSADGALQEQIETALVFWSRSTAGLSAFVPASRLGGGFSFTSPLEPWDYLGLSFAISLWPGGSRGFVLPQLSSRGADWEPRAEPPGAFYMSGGEGATPAVPEHWRLLAIWPRRETCSGVVYDARDQLAGWSPELVVNELTKHAAGRLVLSDGSSTAVQFTLAGASGLLCVEGDPSYTAERSLILRGRLQATTGGSASALAGLDASDLFRVTVRGSDDGLGVQSVRWAQLDSFLPTAQPLADFAAATGLQPVPEPDDQLFAWSWEGTSTRSAAGDWTTAGKFSVLGGHEEIGMICQGMLEPPPGKPRPPPAPPMCESFPFPRLADTLISAELQP